jgi:hypothetical protein
MSKPYFYAEKYEKFHINSMCFLGPQPCHFCVPLHSSCLQEFQQRVVQGFDKLARSSSKQSIRIIDIARCLGVQDQVQGHCQTATFVVMVLSSSILYNACWANSHTILLMCLNHGVGFDLMLEKAILICGSNNLLCDLSPCIP